MFCLDGVALKTGKLFSLVEILVFIPANGLKMVHSKIVNFDIISTLVIKMCKRYVYGLGDGVAGEIVNI